MSLSTKDHKVIAAPRERVWQAWITPAEVCVWNKLRNAEMPTRVGGVLHWEFDIAGTIEHHFLARLMATEPGRFQEYEWFGETGDAPTRMRIEMVESGSDRTEVFIEHSGFAETQHARMEFDGHDHHWGHNTERLAAYLENRPTTLAHQVRTGIIPLGGTTDLGMMIKDVAVGSAAEVAGIRPKDVLVSINGRPMRCIEDLHVWLDEATPGTVATFELADRTVEVVPRTPVAS
jgi:uncharacterized protein YndB with AHSA1/START domain